VEQFIEDQENKNTRKKTQQNVALLKEFLTLRNESRPYRRNSPEGAECIAKFIISVRKKGSNEYYEPSTLLSLLVSFEWYLKKKNYGLSIMKDAEFEQARTVSECSTTTVHSAGSTSDYRQRSASNVDLYRCCYLWWSFQHLYQQP